MRILLALLVWLLRAAVRSRGSLALQEYPYGIVPLALTDSSAAAGRSALGAPAFVS